MSIDGAAHSDDARPRRRGAWSRRCPFCLSTAALAPAPRGALQCAACEAVLASPTREEELPPWETAPELAEAWDAYSRPGQLLEEWGRSTDRQDGGPPPQDELEHMAPRVRSPWVPGRQDELLDAAVRAYVDQTEGLRDAVGDLVRLALRLVRATVEEAQRTRRRPSGASSEAPKSNMGHRAPTNPSRLQPPPASEEQASDGLPDVVDVDAHLFRGGHDAQHEQQDHVLGLEVAVPNAGVPGWYVRFFNAARLATLSQYAALYIVLTNALKERGVEIDKTLDLIHPRTRRDTPFAGLRHALAAFYGLDEPAEASPLPRNAIAKFKLPSGVVFNQIACKPSRSYAASAHEPSSDETDVDTALGAARVGARTYCEAGGRLRREPGRPLLDWERELVRLVDAGEERATAHQSRLGRIDSLAVERLTFEEALPKLKRFDTAPRTIRELKIAHAAVRHALRLALEDRGLIPSAGAPAPEPEEASSPAPTAKPVPAPSSKRRPGRGRRPDAFTGVGAAA